LYRTRVWFLAICVVSALALSPRAGSGTPIISVAPDSIVYPPTPQGEAWSGIASVFNTGNSDLIVTSATTTNGVFTVSSSTPITVPPGEFRNISHRFYPADSILYTGDFIIQSNDPVTPTWVIPMRGQGLPGAPPAIVVFPDTVRTNLVPGNTKSKFFHVRNAGFHPLTFSINTSGFPSWFDVDITADTLGHDQGRYVWLLFDAAGIPEDTVLTGTLYIDHNDTTRGSVGVSVVMTVLLTPLPEIAFSDTTFTFSDVFLPGSGGVEILRVYNVGPDILSGTLIPSSGEYMVSNPSFWVGSGGNHFTLIDYAPTSSGVHDDTITVASNDPVRPLISLLVFGRAVDLTAFVVTDSISDALAPGDSSAHTIRIQHPGGFDTGVVLWPRVIHPDEPQTMAARPGPRVSTPLAAWETAAGFPSQPQRGGNGESSIGAQGPFAQLPFYSDFEGGDFTEWRVGGSTALHDVVSTTAANGTSFSLRETQSEVGHANGLFVDFGYARLTYVSFWVRPGSVSHNDCYVTFHDDQSNEVIFFFALSTGDFYVNANVGGNTSFSYQADTWYHIELRDIDFGAQSFDYYVDGGLVQAGVPFRNTGAITNIARVDIYNFTAGATGYWDEIEMIGDLPTWLFATTDTVLVPAGGSVDEEVFIDTAGLPEGTYRGFIDIASVDRPVTIGSVPVTLIVDSTATAVIGKAPAVTVLEQNYPNPFNPTTHIEFFVAGRQRAELAVFDVKGRRVRTLFVQDNAAGRQKVSWNGIDDNGVQVASGIYFYRLKMGDAAFTRKMVLLK